MMKNRNLCKNIGIPFLLAAVFALLPVLSWQKGYLYGSTIDWYSQHVKLAETIRDTCLSEGTLAPSWLPLGGGSNGYQFAYYGYFRPDILIGCLMPGVSMTVIVTAYALAGYLASVLLLYRWLLDEGLEPFFSFLGGMLFLMAGCFFHSHRQIMFVNYMPFLILALMMIKKKRYALVCVSLFLIYLNSFYYAIACLAVAVWYWYRQEGRKFFGRCFLCVSLSVGMAMMLLLPAFLVILEHRHSGERATVAADLFMPNLVNLLYSPYGMGLTIVSLYLLLAGLGCRKYRKTSILFLLITVFGAASWVLNATLYARAKILIPFVPLLILHNISILRGLHQGELRWRLWPFAVLVPAILSQWGKQWFVWIVADTAVLAAVVLVSVFIKGDNRLYKRNALILRACPYLLLLVMPALIYLRIAQGESWAEVPGQAAFSREEIAQSCENPLYRSDSISDALNQGNVLDFPGQQKTTMYSSVTNAAYQSVYYDLLKTPIQINNRTALLAEENPFLEYLMGVRYLITTKDKIPAGYQVIKQRDEDVIVENSSVLPIAYTTSECMGERQFEQLDGWEKLEAVLRYTIVPDKSDVPWSPRMETVEPVQSSNAETADSAAEIADSAAEIADPAAEIADSAIEITEAELPGNVQIEKTENGYRLKVKKTSTVTLQLKESVSDILMLQFHVKNRSRSAVVISVNGIKNKLSGSTAPYPNENYDFSYQLSENGGIDTITVQLSKGSYDITDIQWKTFSPELLSVKTVEPVTLREQEHPNGHSVLSCTAGVKEDGYFATSIPVQRGMRLFVDGMPTDIEVVNQAFVGAKLSEGVHEIELQFFPPGQRAGYAVSLLSGAAFAGICIWKKRRNL